MILIKMVQWSCSNVIVCCSSKNKMHTFGHCTKAPNCVSLVKIDKCRNHLIDIDTYTHLVKYEESTESESVLGLSIIITNAATAPVV